MEAFHHHGQAKLCKSPLTPLKKMGTLAFRATVVEHQQTLSPNVYKLLDTLVLDCRKFTNKKQSPPCISSR